MNETGYLIGRTISCPILKRLAKPVDASSIIFWGTNNKYLSDKELSLFELGLLDIKKRSPLL